MSRKHFSWLLIVTLLVAVMVLVLPGKTGRESSIEQSVFLPGLAGQVNDIDWLRLTAAGGVTIATFSREAGYWTVEEASGYRADWNVLKGFLASLSRAEIIEVKTDNPEYYARLGVEDVGSDEAAGVLVEFSQDSGIPPVVIGNNAKARDGQYVRLRDSAESVLIDSRVNLPKQKSGWLDTVIVDISDAEVVEFVIEQSEGEPIRALKASADDENFELQNIPDGREIKSSWSVNAPANSLAALDLEDVVPAGQLGWDGATKFRLVTADGLTVEADLIDVKKGDDETGSGDTGGDEHWIRLQAGVYNTALGSISDAAGDHSATIARAEDINRRVNGWAYRIPGYKHEPMVRKMEDLLQ